MASDKRDGRLVSTAVYMSRPHVTIVQCLWYMLLLYIDTCPCLVWQWYEYATMLTITDKCDNHNVIYLTLLSVGSMLSLPSC